MKHIITIILIVLSMALGRAHTAPQPERTPFPSYDYNAGQ